MPELDKLPLSLVNSVVSYPLSLQRKRVKWGSSERREEKGES
jgi:hypothetical protein